MTKPLPATAISTSSATSRRRRQQRLGIDEHPDRHEEQDREQVAERDDLGGGLVGDVRLRDDDPGDERAERQRQPEHGARDERGEERGRDDGQQEQLARALPRHRPQDPRHDPGPDEVGEREEERRLAQGEEQRTDHVAAGQRRQRDDERDRDQVLDDRPADRHAAVERVELAPVDAAT